MANETNDPTPAPKPTRQEDRYNSINAFIRSTDTAFSGALLSVLPMLQKVGYPKVAITAKLADLETLRSLTEGQRKEYGNQYKASDEYDDQMPLLPEDYPDHVALARIAFEEDPPALTALDVVRRRQRNLDDYSRQALQFYNGVLANTGYKAKLAESGIDEAMLTAMQSSFKKLETLDKVHTTETGETQEATVARDIAWDAQEDWMRIFYRKAKIALKKAPQLREKLGMIER